MTQEVTEADLRYLRRCLELATEAVEAGDFPFGSVLARRTEPFSPRTGTGS